MKKRTRTVFKFFIYTVVGFTVVSLLLFFWFSRSPTTQLIDASGKQLTAGNINDQSEELVGDSLFVKAKTLIKSKNFEAAKEQLLRIIVESDRDGEACILLCNVSRELKDMTAAVDFGLKATKLLPESAEAHLSYIKALSTQMFSEVQGIGGMLSAMTKVGHLLEQIDRVIELNPEDTDARTMLVFLNMAPKPFGNIDKAIKVSNEIKVHDPVRGIQLLAVCYNRKKETEQAIALLLDGIKKYPNENSFHVTLADIFSEQERFDDADAEYEAARRSEKDEVYYRSLYGQARMRIQNEFEAGRAVELLEEFIADEPEGEIMHSVAHAYWRKGNALEQMGSSQDAREAYEKSLHLDPAFKSAKKALENLQD